MGAASKVAASFATYPLQVIKSRLQQRQGMHGSQHQYVGVVDCAKTVIKHEGLAGFYKGIVVNLYKVVPTSALMLTVYEQVRSVLAAR